MQETVVRYGIRQDAPWVGYPLCEAITYMQVEQDHPGARQLADWPGWWAELVVADPLPADATVVDRAGFVLAWSDWHTSQGLIVPPLPGLPAETVHVAPSGGEG